MFFWQLLSQGKYKKSSHIGNILFSIVQDEQMILVITCLYLQPSFIKSTDSQSIAIAFLPIGIALCPPSYPFPYVYIHIQSLSNHAITISLRDALKNFTKTGKRKYGGGFGFSVDER